MYVVKKKVPDDNTKNYLLYDKEEFWFRIYKTAKSELKKSDATELIVPVSKDLMNNINLYFKYHPLICGKKIPVTGEIPFLVTYDGKPLKSVNAITYILNKTFGKNVGSSLLRHIYTSEKYGKVLDDMKADAVNMSHSLGQQKDYIKQ